MKSIEFCYWLQGFFEIGNPRELNEVQLQIVKNHLNMVFFHEIDKSYPKGEQLTLNHLHTGESLNKIMSDLKPTKPEVIQDEFPEFPNARC